jgi:hypothetical protein
MEATKELTLLLPAIGGPTKTGILSMTIQVGSYEFCGPFRSSAMLLKNSGVYAVLGGDSVHEWEVIDIGESANLRHRVLLHTMAGDWRHWKYLVVAVATLYVPLPDRMIINQELRATYLPHSWRTFRPMAR